MYISRLQNHVHLSAHVLIELISVTPIACKNHARTSFRYIYIINLGSMFDYLWIFHALYSRCRMAHFCNILPTGCKLILIDFKCRKRSQIRRPLASPIRGLPPRFLACRPAQMGTVDFCDRREKRLINERGRSRHGGGLRAKSKSGWTEVARAPQMSLPETGPQTGFRLRRAQNHNFLLLRAPLRDVRPIYVAEVKTLEISRFENIMKIH